MDVGYVLCRVAMDVSENTHSCTADAYGDARWDILENNVGEAGSFFADVIADMA
jgi:hypothetical protein